VTSALSNPLSVPATTNVETLKVSTRSNPNSVAGAIAGAIRSSGAVWIQVVGAGALNQATKASVIARGILSASGLDIVVTPSFADIEIDGEARTALRLRLEDRDRRRPLPDASRPSTHGAVAPSMGPRRP
jgi:stage V sporulation protein S